MKAKKKRTMIGMLVLLVLLVIALVVLQLRNQETEEVKTGTTAQILTEFKAAEINHVTYQYRDAEALNYVYVKDTWYNEDDKEFPLSSSAFANNFVTAFAGLTTRDEVKDPDGDEVYGLANPYLTLTVDSVSGKQETFYLGDYNTMLQSYYMKKAGSDQVYLVEEDMLYICRQDMYDYAQLESFPGYTKKNLQSISMINDGNVTELFYFEDGYETDQIGNCVWFFGAPFEFYRSAETNKVNDFEEETLSLMQFSKLVNYKPTAEDIESYGLNQSTRQYVIRDTVTTDNASVKRTQTVEFGAFSEKDEGYYARVTVVLGNTKSVSDNIYLVDKASVDSLLGIDPLSYVYKYTMYVKLSDVADANSGILFETPEMSYELKNQTTFTEDGKEDVNIYYLNDKLVEETDFESFYFDLLANCGMEQLLYDKSKLVTDVEPTYKITYRCNKTDENGDPVISSYYGNEIVVTYTKYDANYYQVSINGKTDTLVNKRVMDETMAQLAEMMKK